MFSDIRLSPLPFIIILSLLTNRVLGVGSDIVCSTVAGTAKLVTQYNSCICLTAASTAQLAGTLCPTDPNGQAGCQGSCGLNCLATVGGKCFITCNSGYALNAAGVCSSTCNTGAICTVDTTNPLFKYAVPSCKAGGTGCDYSCTKGQKGCAGKDGCFSTCLNGTGIPQAKRRRDALQAEREKRKRIAGSIASGPVSSGGMFADDDICPVKGQLACPVPGATEKDSFECIDPKVDLMSCGGCVAEGGSGMDCSALEGAENVQCVNGSCRIGSCKTRYRLIQGLDGQPTCVRSNHAVIRTTGHSHL